MDTCLNAFKTAHLAISCTPLLYARASLVRFQGACLRSSREFAVISRGSLGHASRYACITWYSCFSNSSTNLRMRNRTCVNTRGCTRVSPHPHMRFPFPWYPVDTGCPVKVALPRSIQDRLRSRSRRCSWPVVFRSEPIRLRLARMFQRTDIIKCRKRREKVINIETIDKHDWQM